MNAWQIWIVGSTAGFLLGRVSMSWQIGRKFILHPKRGAYAKMRRWHEG